MEGREVWLNFVFILFIYLFIYLFDFYLFIYLFIYFEKTFGIDTNKSTLYWSTWRPVLIFTRIEHPDGHGGIP